MSADLALVVLFLAAAIVMFVINRPRMDAVALEMAGSVKAIAWQIMRRGGTTVTAGLPHPDHRFPLPRLLWSARSARSEAVTSAPACRFGTCRYVELYRHGQLPVDRLLSERVRVDELNEPFDDLASGRTIRQVLVI